MDFISADLSMLNLETFMREALVEADAAGQAGELPVGSVVAIKGEIVSKGRACHRGSRSQVRHAELNAILIGGEALWQDYEHAILFTTLEPCPMCLGAAVMADIPHIIFALADKSKPSRQIVETNAYVRHHIKSYYGGVLAREAKAIFERYDPNALPHLTTGSVWGGTSSEG